MTTCAVCNISDNQVINVILAEPTDLAYEGCYLAEINETTNPGGIGHTYVPEKNKFIAPQPYASWSLDTDSCLWMAPVAMPQDGNSYYWDETTLTWIMIDGN